MHRGQLNPAPHPDAGRGSEIEASRAEAFRNPVWLPDTDTCMACGEEFGRFWGGRHHCRKCGWVVCDECMAPEVLVLQSWLSDTQDHPIKTACVTCKPKQKKVCKYCYDQLVTVLPQEVAREKAALSWKTCRSTQHRLPEPHTSRSRSPAFLSFSNISCQCGRFQIPDFRETIDGSNWNSKAIPEINKSFRELFKGNTGNTRTDITSDAWTQIESCKWYKQESIVVGVLKMCTWAEEENTKLFNIEPLQLFTTHKCMHEVMESWQPPEEYLYQGTLMTIPNRPGGTAFAGTHRVAPTANLLEHRRNPPRGIPKTVANLVEKYMNTYWTGEATLRDGTGFNGFNRWTNCPQIMDIVDVHSVSRDGWFPARVLGVVIDLTGYWEISVIYLHRAQTETEKIQGAPLVIDVQNPLTSRSVPPTSVDVYRHPDNSNRPHFVPGVKLEPVEPVPVPPVEPVEPEPQGEVPVPEVPVQYEEDGYCVNSSIIKFWSRVSRHGNYRRTGKEVSFKCSCKVPLYLFLQDSRMNHTHNLYWVGRIPHQVFTFIGETYMVSPQLNPTWGDLYRESGEIKITSLTDYDIDVSQLPVCSTPALYPLSAARTPSSHPIIYIPGKSGEIGNSIRKCFTSTDISAWTQVFTPAGVRSAARTRRQHDVDEILHEQNKPYTLIVHREGFARAMYALHKYKSKLRPPSKFLVMCPSFNGWVDTDDGSGPNLMLNQTDYTQTMTSLINSHCEIHTFMFYGDTDRVTEEYWKQLLYLPSHTHSYLDMMPDLSEPPDERFCEDLQYIIQTDHSTTSGPSEARVVAKVREVASARDEYEGRPPKILYIPGQSGETPPVIHSVLAGTTGTGSGYIIYKNRQTRKNHVEATINKYSEEAVPFTIMVHGEGFARLMYYLYQKGHIPKCLTQVIIISPYFGVLVDDKTWHTGDQETPLHDMLYRLANKFVKVVLVKLRGDNISGGISVRSKEMEVIERHSNTASTLEHRDVDHQMSQFDWDLLRQLIRSCVPESEEPQAGLEPQPGPS